jgi:hypothetical protein
MFYDVEAGEHMERQASRIAALERENAKLREPKVEPQQRPVFKLPLRLEWDEVGGAYTVFDADDNYIMNNECYYPTAPNLDQARVIVAMVNKSLMPPVEHG